MIRWFVHNPVAANLLMAFILIGGLFAINRQITYEIFPSVQPDAISISTVYEGAAPEQVDRLLVAPIEQAIKDLDGVDRIVSVANEGNARMSVELTSGADKEAVKTEIEDAINGINSLPSEAEDPEVSIPERQRRSVQLVIYGDIPQPQLAAYTQVLESSFGAIEGVLSTESYGLSEREYTIKVRPEVLQRYQLNLPELASIIQAETNNYTLGTIDSQRGRILLKSDGERLTPDAYLDVKIKTLGDGSVLRLADVATVEDGFESDDFKVSLDGQKAAFINLYQTQDANILDISEAARDKVATAQANLPAGVHLKISSDSSTAFKSRLNTLVTNGIQGGLLVLSALALLLKLRFAFWVALGIPVTFLGGFMMMPWFDVTLNMLSMFGYILVLGIVVDDAIVTAENVYVHYQRHGDIKRAAMEGTEEIAVPVTFGVMTTVAAFLPFFLVTGNMGALFAFLAVVVIAVLMFSLLESKLILPAHLSQIKVDSSNSFLGRIDYFFGRISNGFERGVTKFYKPLIRFCITNIGATLGFYIASLIILVSLVVGGITPFQFFPRIPGDSISLNLTMPTGTPYERTLEVTDQIESAAIELQSDYSDAATNGLISDILVRVGGNNPETASVEFQLAPESERSMTISNSQLLRQWQSYIGPLAGVESIDYRTQAFSGGSDVSLALISDQVSTLKEAADVVANYMSDLTGVSEINTSLSDGRREVNITLTAKAESLDVPLSRIAQQVRSAANGALVDTLLINGDEVDVRVRYPAGEYDSIAKLERLPIQTASGFIPLSELAVLEEQIGSSSINREDGRLLGTVSAAVNEEVALSSEVQAELEAQVPELLTNFPQVNLEPGSEQIEQRETNESIFFGMLLAALLIYVLLAIPFKSYGKPFIVLFVIPFAFGGVILGHWLYGSPIYMPSLLGMMALFGILMNGSLVLVAQINKELEAGLPLKEAVVEGSVRRFRPIFLTTLTTIVGVAPLLFETSLQAEFLKPMAISLCFGIFFGTLVTLILVPVNFIIYETLSPLYGPLVRSIFAMMLGALVIYGVWALDGMRYVAPLFDRLAFF